MRRLDLVAARFRRDARFVERVVSKDEVEVRDKVRLGIGLVLGIDKG